MENLKSYHDFLNEGKIQEKEGISPAIYSDLKDYFEACKKDAQVPNIKGAQKHIQSKKKDWKLSSEDFEEAKKEFAK
jgi:hypothetical protein